MRAGAGRCRSVVLLVYAVAVSAAMPAAAARPAHYYASPDGNDEWSGRAASPNRARTDGPFATVARARTAVRAHRAAHPMQPVTVRLRAGTYQLEEPLRFTHEDSGTDTAPVVYESYPGEKATISGGVRLTGWKLAQDGRWQLHIPDVASGAWNFEQLFVNDVRRPRPRIPKGSSFLHIAREVPATTASREKGFDRFGFAPGDIRPDWANPGDVQLLPFHIWTMSRMRIATVDPAESIVTLTGHTASAAYYHKLTAGHRYVVENAKEALDEAGEWYLDRASGTLTYIPMPGETIAGTRIVAPRLEQLVVFEGDVAGRSPAQHITLRCLTLTHTNWVTPPEGYSPVQADYTLGAAIAGARAGARHCTIDECDVCHTGAWAVAWRDGCAANTLVRCNLHDLGAGGVIIGLPPEGHTPPPHTEGNTVEDCFIARGGRIHPSATGVLVGHASHTTVAHNTIEDFYYTGISVGWSWGYAPSAAHHNTIAHNSISRIGQGLLSDMGGIYTLGVSPGTVIEHNRICDVDSFDYGGWGIYFDEGTSGVVARNNITLRTKFAGFHQHYGRGNLLENNVFAFGRHEQIARSRPEEHLSFRFVRNIVLSDKPEMLGGNWAGSNYFFDDNVYWNASGTTVTFAGGSPEQWRAAGQDVHSLVADPLFRDARRGDFRLRAGSPARRTGFVSIDMDGVGIRRPRPRLAASP